MADCGSVEFWFVPGPGGIGGQWYVRNNCQPGCLQPPTPSTPGTNWQTIIVPCAPMAGPFVAWDDPSVGNFAIQDSDAKGMTIATLNKLISLFKVAPTPTEASKPAPKNPTPYPLAVGIPFLTTGVFPIPVANPPGANTGAAPVP
jgi:hypothetical protein